MKQRITDQFLHIYKAGEISIVVISKKNAALSAVMWYSWCDLEIEVSNKETSALVEFIQYRKVLKYVPF